MSGNNPSKDMTHMDAHAAQNALAEALEAEMEAGEEIVSDDEETAQRKIVSMGRDDTTGAEGGDGDDEAIAELFDMDENPFAAAAEFAEHVRMAEALLFAAMEPLDEATIADRLPDGAQVKDILEALQKQYESRGVTLNKSGRKWQFVTAPDVAHVLQREQVQPKKLTRAALETLAIIAYHQPCTRAEIEEVRGVAVSKGSLDTLMEIGWIRLRGRKEDTPGRPLLYGTSQEFLENFGLASVSHLPGMADLKAAGLLDARLPPDFVVPTPKDGDEMEQEENEAPETDFVQDYHEGREDEEDEAVDECETAEEDTLDAEDPRVFAADDDDGDENDEER